MGNKAYEALEMTDHLLHKGPEAALSYLKESLSLAFTNQNLSLADSFAAKYAGAAQDKGFGRV